MQNPPEPTTVPAIEGQNFFLGSLTAILKDPLVFLEEARQKYGSRFRFRLLRKTVWVFSDPQDVHKVFFECAPWLEKSAQRAAFGKSVLTSNGEDWKRMRRSVAPFFQKERLEQFLPLMHQMSRLAVQDAIEKKEIDLYDFIGKLINDVIVTILFGTNADGTAGDLRGPTEAITDYTIKFTAVPFKVPDWIPLKVIREKNRAFSFFNELIADLLSSSQKDGDRITFLESLSRLGEAPPEEIRTQCLAFYLAGFETTVNSLFWTFLEIFRAQGLMSELRDEARAALSQNPTTTEKLEESLPLLRSVLMESLRLWPPIWSRMRVANADFSLGPARIKKGDLLWVSPFLNHRCSKAWRDPTRFEPRRFLGKPWPKDASYYPFSMGLNTCTGKDLAWLEMLVLTANLVATVDWKVVGEIPDPFPRKTRVSVRPDRSLRVSVRAL